MSWLTPLVVLAVTLLWCLCTVGSQCVIQSFGDALSDEDVWGGVQAQKKICEDNQRIEHISVYHGNWVDDIYFYCDETVGQTALLGNDLDPDIEQQVCKNNGGIRSISSQVYASQPPSDMYVACQDGTEFGPFGTNAASYDPAYRKESRCDDGYYATGFSYYPPSAEECMEINPDFSYCPGNLAYLQLLCLPIECLGLTSSPKEASSPSSTPSPTSESFSPPGDDTKGNMSWDDAQEVVISVIGGVLAVAITGSCGIFYYRARKQNKGNGGANHIQNRPTLEAPSHGAAMVL